MKKAQNSPADGLRTDEKRLPMTQKPRYICIFSYFLILQEFTCVLSLKIKMDDTRLKKRRSRFSFHISLYYKDLPIKVYTNLLTKTFASSSEKSIYKNA